MYKLSNKDILIQMHYKLSNKFDKFDHVMIDNGITATTDGYALLITPKIADVPDGVYRLSKGDKCFILEDNPKLRIQYEKIIPNRFTHKLQFSTHPIDTVSSRFQVAAAIYEHAGYTINGSYLELFLKSTNSRNYDIYVNGNEPKKAVKLCFDTDCVAYIVPLAQVYECDLKVITHSDGTWEED